MKNTLKRINYDSDDIKIFGNIISNSEFENFLLLGYYNNLLRYYDEKDEKYYGLSYAKGIISYKLGLWDYAYLELQKFESFFEKKIKRKRYSNVY